MKTLGLVLILLGMTGALYAPVPEIDPASGVSALTLLAGVLLIVRARK